MLFEEADGYWMGKQKKIYQKDIIASLLTMYCSFIIIIIIIITIIIELTYSSTKLPENIQKLSYKQQP